MIPNFYSRLNRVSSNDDFAIRIENLEISNNHWHSFDRIKSFIYKLDLLLVGQPSWVNQRFEKQLIEYFIEINKKNPETEKIIFYNDPAYPNTLVCLFISDIPTVTKNNFLKRNIVVRFKKHTKVLVITDITCEEWADKAKKLPSQWQLNDALSGRFRKLKQLFLL